MNLKNWLFSAVIVGNALISFTIFGGPGSSGGNKPMSIGGLSKNYFFRSPYPSKVENDLLVDRYEFSLAGYKLNIEPGNASYLGYCPQSFGDKHVCATSIPGQISALIVFGTGDSYRITMRTMGLDDNELKMAFESFILGFTQLKTP